MPDAPAPPVRRTPCAYRSRRMPGISVSKGEAGTSRQHADHPRQRVGIDRRIDSQPHAGRQLDPYPAAAKLSDDRCRQGRCRLGDLDLTEAGLGRHSQPGQRARHRLPAPGIDRAAAALVALDRRANRTPRARMHRAGSPASAPRSSAADLKRARRSGSDRSYDHSYDCSLVRPLALLSRLPSMLRSKSGNQPVGQASRKAAFRPRLLRTTCPYSTLNIKILAQV